jgi:hypothetical protein
MRYGAGLRGWLALLDVNAKTKKQILRSAYPIPLARNGAPNCCAQDHSNRREPLKDGTVCFDVVFDGVEEKTARGSSGAGESAIAGGEDCGDVVEVHVAAGDVEHGTDKIANHVVKKSIAAHAINEEIEAVGGLLAPVGRVDGADGGAGFNPID